MAILADGWSYAEWNARLQDDVAELEARRELVLEAARHDRSALQYAAAELTADSEFVLEAMRQCGDALQDAVAEAQVGQRARLVVRAAYGAVNTRLLIGGGSKDKVLSTETR